MSGSLPSIAAGATDVWDPALAGEFDAAMAKLRVTKSTSGALLLIGSLAAFILLESTSGTSRNIAVLVGVLLFHELGHFAGMHLFGYRDVKMFFIPFFGAAVAGKRAGAAAWKEGVVLLLGPLPGIVVGVGMVLLPGEAPPAMRQIAVMLLIINAFNLLPLAGLDGARLLQLILFSGHPRLEIAFQACAGLLAGAVAIATGTLAFGALAFIVVAFLPFRWRILAAARQLRASGMSLPVDAQALDADTGRVVFLAARSALSGESRSRPGTVASTMSLVLEAARDERPSLRESVALGVAFLLALVLGVLGVLLLRIGG